MVSGMSRILAHVQESKPGSEERSTNDGQHELSGEEIPHDDETAGQNNNVAAAAADAIALFCARELKYLRLPLTDDFVIADESRL